MMPGRSIRHRFSTSAESPRDGRGRPRSVKLVPRPVTRPASRPPGCETRTMAWIPHLMVLDDDPRVLESLIPSFPTDLARDLGRDRVVGEALRRGDPGGGGAIHVKVTAHGYESERLAAYRHRTPHHVH